MFEYIHGTLKKKTPLVVVIDTNGIGYKIWIPLSAFSDLPCENEQALMYISFIVKEDAQTLYGFLKEEERDLFEKLISVSGIGPKSAINILGHIELAALYRAVQNNDPRAFHQIPGIGKKTAQRLLLELKDILKGQTDNTPSMPLEGGSLIQDAVAALMHLGYSEKHAEKMTAIARKKHQDETDLAQFITKALQG